jgi:hypothetical protein
VGTAGRDMGGEERRNASKIPGRTPNFNRSCASVRSGIPLRDLAGEPAGAGNRMNGSSGEPVPG